MDVRKSKASPLRGGGSAKPGRRGYSKFAATSQSALRLTAPLEGEPWMVHIPQAPFTQGSLWVVVVQGTENDCCFLGRDAA